MFLDSLTVEVGRVGLQFSPRKCAILRQDFSSSQISKKIVNSVFSVGDSFVYLGRTIESGSEAVAEVSRRIGLARSVMKSLKHI